MKSVALTIGFVSTLLSVSGFGQRSPGSTPTPLPQLQRNAELESNLKWQRGNIILGENLATLRVSPQFRYLSAQDAKIALVNLWGNPPASASRTLGMIFPADVSPTSRDSWAVVITYQANGYVKDNDAENTNYADLLRQIQKAAADANPERVKQGYPEMTVVGWAEPPHYDKENHKLYWAKELQFGDSQNHTLNYSIRAPGRQGVLELNAIAGMSDLDALKARMPEVISMIDFNPGNRYADFNPGRDKVAEYGLAALILGGVAAKVGLFKGLFLALLAAKKFVVIAIVVALLGFIGRIFGIKKKSKTLPSVPSDVIGNGPGR